MNEELDLIEKEIVRIYKFQEVEWSVFIKAAHKMDTLVRDSQILYAHSYDNASVVASQSSKTYKVVASLLPLEEFKTALERVPSAMAKSRRRKLSAETEKIKERLKAVNDKTEALALVKHFKTHTVELIPNESGNPEIRPKCYYSRYYLYFGKLLTEEYAESMKLFEDALTLLRKAYRSGIVTYQDGVLSFVD